MRRLWTWALYVNMALVMVSVLAVVVLPGFNLLSRVAQMVEGPPPFEVIGTPAGKIMPNGLWRITITTRKNEACDSTLWDRSFKDAGAPALRRVDAVADSSGLGLDSIQASPPTIEQRPPGVYTDWWDYRPEPGKVGSFSVLVSPGWCKSGWSRTYDLFSVPYDWRDIPIRNGQVDSSQRQLAVYSGD